MSSSKRKVVWGITLLSTLIGISAWVLLPRSMADLVDPSSTEHSAQEGSSQKNPDFHLVQEGEAIPPARGSTRVPLPRAFAVRVNDTQGKPIPGAKVSLWNGSEEKVQGRTDPDGEFSLDEIPFLSSGTLRVDHTDYTPEIRKLIKGRSSYSVTLFDRRSIRGKTVGPDGKGIARVRLRLSTRTMEALSAPEKEIITEIDGKFHFQGLTREFYSIRVESDSHVPVDGPVVSVGKDQSLFLTIRMRPIQAVVIRYQLPEGVPLPGSTRLRTSGQWKPVKWMRFYYPEVAEKLLRGVKHDDCELYWARPGIQTARVTIKVRGFETVEQDIPVSTFGQGGQIKVHTCELKPLRAWKLRTVKIVDADSKLPVDGILPTSIFTLEGPGKEKVVVGYGLDLRNGLGNIMLPEGDYSFRFGMYWSDSFRKPIKATVSDVRKPLEFKVALGGAMKIVVKSTDGAVRKIVISSFRMVGEAPKQRMSAMLGLRSLPGEPLLLEWLNPGDYNVSFADQDGKIWKKAIRVDSSKTTLVEF